MKTTGAKLSAKEVCDILGACKEAHVVELQLGDLHIHFGPKAVDQSEQLIPPGAVAREIDPQVAKQTFAQEVARHREEVLADLLITNPLEYERMIASGELEENA